jgi:hypothetical protein
VPSRQTFAPAPYSVRLSLGCVALG